MKNITKFLCLHIDVTDRGQKNRLLLGKYHLKVVQINHCKFELGCSQKFQKWHSRKIECLDISNFVTSNVTEFI